MGKIFLLQGAAHSKLWTLALVLVMSTLISYWYYLRVAWFMWMKDAPSPEAHSAVVAPFLMRVALVIAVGLVLFLGIFPGTLLEVVQESVDPLFNVGGFLMGMAP